MAHSYGPQRQGYKETGLYAAKGFGSDISLVAYTYSAGKEKCGTTALYQALFKIRSNIFTNYGGSTPLQHCKLVCQKHIEQQYKHI